MINKNIMLGYIIMIYKEEKKRGAKGCRMILKMMMKEKMR